MLTTLLRRLETRHRAWRYRTRIDPAEIAWMRQLLRPGDTVVDAGAYKGGYTYWMRHAVGSSGSVYAFEPQPELAAFLTRSVNAFGWTNVHVQASALSSTRGKQDIHVPSTKGSQRGSLAVERAGARTYPVATETIDTVFSSLPDEERIALIKCDVEGHELELFRGAHRTLTNHRPRLLFECEARFQSHDHVDKVFSYLKEIGYRGHFFWKGRLHPLEDFRLEVHQVQGARHRANNFMFDIAEG